MTQILWVLFLSFLEYPMFRKCEPLSKTLLTNNDKEANNKTRNIRFETLYGLTYLYHISCKAGERKDESSRDNGANLEKRKTKITFFEDYLALNYIKQRIITFTSSTLPCFFSQSQQLSVINPNRPLYTLHFRTQHSTSDISTSWLFFISFVHLFCPLPVRLIRSSTIYFSFSQTIYGYFTWNIEIEKINPKQKF